LSTIFGYFLPAFVARAFAEDFWEDVSFFDFFFGFFFSQIGLFAIVSPSALGALVIILKDDFWRAG
jgi:hypothetical protein